MSGERDGLRQYVVKAGETATEPFEWGDITWLDNAEITGSETLTLGVVNINPGEANPEHYHPNCDEVLHIMAGAIEHSIEGVWYPMATGDTIHIPQGSRHQARNLGQTMATVVVCYNTGRRETIGNFGAGER